MSIRNRSSIVCIYQNKILALKYQDPHSKKVFWGIPGGQIDPPEKPERTAMRETLEETKIHIVLDRKKRIIQKYSFYWNGKIVLCRTFFISAKPVKIKLPKHRFDATYILERKWIPVSQINRYFHNHPIINTTIKSLIR